MSGVRVRLLSDGFAPRPKSRTDGRETREEMSSVVHKLPSFFHYSSE